MGMNFGADAIEEDGTFDINITPLIDIVFLLLIFFMVSTTFDNPNSIGVKLPTAQRNAPQNESENIRITVQEDGSLYLGKEAVTFAELDARFAELSKKSEQGRLVVNADEASTHGAVVRVMDIAKRNGIDKIAIATKPGTE